MKYYYFLQNAEKGIVGNVTAITIYGQAVKLAKEAAKQFKADIHLMRAEDDFGSHKEIYQVISYKEGK